MLKKNMKLGKINLFLFLFLLYPKIIFSENNVGFDNLNNLPSSFEDLEITEEESFNEDLNLKLKNNSDIEITKDSIAELKALDKISAKTSNLKIKIGEEILFQNLKIKILKCKVSEFDDSPDTIAYMQVIDINQINNDKVFIFNGWTFASSPSLRPFDHAIYGLWLLGCYNV